MFSIRHKLLLSFIGVALLSIPLIIYLMIQFSQATQNFYELIENSMPQRKALMEIKDTVLRISFFISNFNNEVEQSESNESTPTKLGAAKDQLLSYLEEIGELQKIYQQHSKAQNNPTLSTLSSLKKEVILKALDLFSGKEKNLNRVEIDQKIHGLELAQKKLEQFINDEISIQTEALEASKNQALKSLNLSRMLVLIATVLALVGACIISFILSRWISKPIISLRNFTRKINPDNLNLRIPIVSKDEIGDLGIAVNKMLENLSSAQTQIIEASRLAGVAEVATSVMHIVGNLLNNTYTSVSLLRDRVHHSKILLLSKLYEMLEIHKDNLNDFLKNDNRGKQILPYFEGIVQNLEQERLDLKNELNSLYSNLEDIRQVITIQLSSEAIVGIVEPLNIPELIERQLSLEERSIQENNIHIVRNYEEIPVFSSVKSKLQQILGYLIKNAIEALISSDNPDKQLIINIKKENNKWLNLSIQDNGTVILKEDIDKIFSFGYTRKKEGTDYGLHLCALLATELKGELSVESNEQSPVTLFMLKIPEAVKPA